MGALHPETGSVVRPVDGAMVRIASTMGRLRRGDTRRQRFEPSIGSGLFFDSVLLSILVASLCAAPYPREELGEWPFMSTFLAFLDMR